MGLDMLDIYTEYLISQNKYATATGLSSHLDGEITHDKVTYFSNKNRSVKIFIQPIFA